MGMFDQLKMASEMMKNTKSGKLEELMKQAQETRTRLKNQISAAPQDVRLQTTHRSSP